ncbi:hypothetical protein EYF80_060897 [Liparis tanakae]|uniref:Uncharacterized protein n=1 Tax=Liparis tanakae TaxID=230148 RepID=A0A4Z2EJB2_9TELE|nr:hypothetical protein EYF80_060897 [Liparis tanakae]
MVEQPGGGRVVWARWSSPGRTPRPPGQQKRPQMESPGAESRPRCDRHDERGDEEPDGGTKSHTAATL